MTAVALALGAVASAGLPRIGAPERAARSRAAQALLGGLGTGFSADLGCEPSFDPRLAAACSRSLDPVPAAGACPAHAAPRVR